MSRILIISDNSECLSRIRELTDNIVTVKTVNKGLDFIRENNDVSTVIIEYPSRKKNVQRFIDTVDVGNNYIYSTAILILTDKDNIKNDIKYLGGPVIDCLSEPIMPEIFTNRLQNAEKLISSVSFSEFSRMLKVLPANIYLKDIFGRYVFSSQTWHHLETNGDPTWIIKGKTDMDIRKDKENAKKAMESDQKLIASGKGMSYIIEENDGEQEFLQIIKEPLFFDDGRIRGIIALINDVTEQERMRRELKERSIRDCMTGTYNRSCFEEYMQSVTEDSFPVGIISADCDRLKFINDTYGHMIGDEYIRMTATLLLSTLPEKCRVFRTGGDEFIVLIPNSTPDEEEMLISALKKGAGSCSIKDNPLSISFGSATAEKKETLMRNIKLADSRMYADKRMKKAIRK